MSASHSRTTVLVLAASMACSLSGCEIVDPADSDTSSASTPPRAVSSACKLSPALAASAPAQVNGAFCFGIAADGGDFLLCAQRDGAITECIDEVAGIAYLVRWAGKRALRSTSTGRASSAASGRPGRSLFEISLRGQGLRTGRGV